MNYYNEFDPAAASWLRELISEGLIPRGVVDDRSITDVTADDLRGFTQCHFFAGIAGWSYALQLAGWDANRPVWTGSCPCQAFSVAGKQDGFADERDLWPAFFNLIKECSPEYVFGEQVENAIKHGWLDRVYRDMEAEGYACGSVVLGAHSVGAPHQRQRLYWGCTLAAISDTDAEQCYQSGETGETGRGESSNGSNGSCRTPYAPCQRCSEERGDSDRMEFSNSQFGKEQCKSKPNGTQQSGIGLPGCIIPWKIYQLIYCQDGAVRRIPAESVFCGVVDGIPEGVDGSGNGGISEVDGFPLTKQKEGRPMLLKGYGNAIVPQVAAEFIKAFMEEYK
jgi:DNA (cytosine-5)-methyltransferase 1